MVLFALRPTHSTGFRNLRKIRTLGVRAAFVGEFELHDHDVPESDVIAETRDAWDAIFGTVTLGKFFLGFARSASASAPSPKPPRHVTRRSL